jgi:hypothetical protein
VKLDLTKDAKMQQISIVQLQLDSTKIANFIEVTIKQLPSDFTRDTKVQEVNILNLKGKAKVLKFKMKGEEDIKIEVLNKIYNENCN